VPTPWYNKPYMPSSELSVMFCYLYVLLSMKNGSIYIGITKDLRSCLAKYNNGLNRSTKAYAPWKLIYYEAHRNENDARRREKYLKTTSGGRAISKMLREELDRFKQQKVYY